MFKKVKGIVKSAVAKVAAVGTGVVAMAGSACAAITMPTMPTTDVEAGATVILGIVAVATGIGILIRVFKKG